jgi:hypothetical protein
VDHDYRRRTLESSWDWLGFAAGLPGKHVALPGPTAWGLVAPGRSLFLGATLANTSGAAVTVTIRDGQDASGDVLAVLVVPANGGLPYVGPSSGVMAEVGIFIASPGASISGALYFVPLWHYPNTAPGE